jgi:hypothetical protein
MSMFPDTKTTEMGVTSVASNRSKAVFFVSLIDTLIYQLELVAW